MAQTGMKANGMDDLAAILQSADLYGWEVRRRRETSDQLYLIFDQVESQRRVESETFLVQIYLLMEKDGRQWLGESGWTANPGDDFAADLAKALERAPWALNPVFHLPGPEQQYKPLDLVDPGLREQPQQALWHVRHDLNRAVAQVHRVQLASAELYVNYREIDFQNHTGLRGSYAETELQTQFALLAAADGQEAESLGWRRAGFYQDLQIDAMVQRYSRYALENAGAGLPPSGPYPVIFGEEALDTIFSHLCAQADGQAAFQGWSRFKAGEAVIKNPRRDLLTLASDPWLPGGLKSRPFDGWGLALKPVTFIQNNIFQQCLADQRYADYLQLPPTGGLTNLRVAPGRATLAEMLYAGTVLHLLRFSTLEPNPVTGAISGEIRTGYLLRQGEAVPIKGGSVSGQLDEAFRYLTLSRETEQRETYFGPAGIRVEEMDIGGA
jgi:predicted Zn-dependent protease